MSEKKQINIAVTGLNATDNPGPGLAVIRSLRACSDFNLHIIGLAYETLEPGIYLHDWVDITYLIPYPSAGTDSLWNRICEINSTEHIDLIIPNFDAELYNFIKLKDKLSSIGIHTYLPDIGQFESRDKTRLTDFGIQHGLNIPETHIIQSGIELTKAIEKLEFPMLIKGRFYDAIIVNSQDEAEKAFYKIRAKWGLPVIAQKFIAGTEINIAVLGDGKGNMISMIPMRKLYITDKGKAWAGITIEADEYTQLAQKFIRISKWRGGCELEVMQDNEGKIHILEINPRFPAWIYLTAAAGQNQPAMLARLALHQQQDEVRHYDVGKIFVRYAWEQITDISEFQSLTIKNKL